MQKFATKRHGSHEISPLAACGEPKSHQQNLQFACNVRLNEKQMIC